MLNRFMISVAALALVAGTGLANAQGTMKNESGAGAQPMQHSQSSGGAAERGGSMGKESTHEKGTVGQAGGSSTMKSGASAEEKSSGAAKEEHSGREMNKNAAEEKSGATKSQRMDQRAQGQQDKSKSMSQDTSKSGAKDQKDMKAEGSKSGASTNNAENQKGTETRTNQSAQGKSSTSTTVGQAGAGAKLSTEQRTQITSVIHEEHVRPVTNVNFSISVGTRIPREGIELHALPSRVVTIYPEWRTYKFVLVKEEIVIINPDTYEIVAVLNA
ncbi:DUF1236 domain-containing protein [Bradyrhizobium arachidis]|uniref:DUF1236 domain-containing protein n=1 Tax=Bradyrhizobium TaxID=374 RepID=UPI00188B1B5E|nr:MULTISPECIES: DUF1236 domain-containing protein [Bradyrhizobium]QOZ53482.1 hypothetical protein XH90_20475 [Bradyrhizobium sp. CCBAU 53338]UVO33997.1 DUF1236 domain-containing protein [Bradyrhizobium arachidis]